MSRPSTLGGYELVRELGRGANGVVYEAFDPRSRSFIALKALSNIDPESIYRLKHEFRALADLEHEHVVRYGELATDGEQWFFTMERVDGGDFVAYVRPFDGACGFDETRLRAALAQLVDGLSFLHSAGGVHRDIKPRNVLVSREGRVVILDFGLLSTVTERIAEGEIVGTPAFMSPEQFEGGAVGPATDWYAVGAMLFVALTGERPFGGDLLSIVVGKANEEFPRPSERAPGVPPDLDALCVDLLRADPTRRPDAAEIRRRLGLATSSRRVSRAPRRRLFVGRSAELARLERALRDVEAGASRAVIVEGEPGVGKTALVHRFIADVAPRALVLAGRCFEQETVPFGGLDSLMDAVAEYLLSVDADDADTMLSGGIGYLAQIFAALLRVPAVAARTSPRRSLESAALVRDLAAFELSRLLTAMSRARPLVIVLDDLHWVSDEGMGMLARAALSGGEVVSLFVATMRAEASRSPAVTDLMAHAERLCLAGLSYEESRSLWDALEAPDSAPQRDDAIREAAGHPLFLSELVRGARSGARAGAGARLRDVLGARIRERDAVERAYLEVAAIAGEPTSHDVLVRAAGLDPSDGGARLGSLRAAQLLRVMRVGSERRVEPYHAHVREAVVAGIGARDALHLRLGRALLESTPADALRARIFVIVHHLQAARHLVTDEADRRQLAELDLLASREALLTTAFDRSSAYAQMGLEHVAGNATNERDLALALDLLTARFEAEYLAGQRARARASFDEALRRSRDPVRRAAVYATWISLESQAAPAAALAVGRAALRELGVPLPRRTTMAYVLVEYAAVRRLHARRTAADIEALPALRDATTRSVLRVLMAIAPPAYFVEPKLYPWIMLRMARLSLAHGLSELAPFGLGGYATLLASVFGRQAEAAELGRLAITLASRFDEPRLAAKIHFMNAMFIVSWLRPFRAAIDEYDAAYALALRHGDTLYEGFAAAGQIYSLFAEGASLRELHERSVWALGIVVRRRDRVQSAIAYSVARYAATLRGQSLDPNALGLRDGETALRAALADAATPMASFWQHLCEAERAYLSGDLASAENHLRATRAHKGIAPTALVEGCFLRALVASAGALNVGAADRARRIASVAFASKKLTAWARECPPNFETYALIVRAELLRILSFSGPARRAYDRAIASAQRWGAPKREALACRLAATHARALGDRDHAAATRYEQQAADAYRAWGAVPITSAASARGA